MNAQTRRIAAIVFAAFGGWLWTIIITIMAESIFELHCRPGSASI